ncbi:MAG: DUF2802 domain-containing protein [Gammaproteobacteria bacterium]|jgi:Protein of unknown function (DUF2802)
MSAGWVVLFSTAILSSMTAGGFVFFIMRRYLQRNEKMSQAAREALAQDLKALAKAVHQSLERLRATERRVREVMERQNRLEMMAPSTERFKHGIALVQRGARAEELMATCGLARGEAELLYLLHRSSASPREADNLT